MNAIVRIEGRRRATLLMSDHRQLNDFHRVFTVDFLYCFSVIFNANTEGVNNLPNVLHIFLGIRG